MVSSLLAGLEAFPQGFRAAIPPTNRKQATMPGAGTDKTKRWVQQPGPVVILVETQLGDNIGSAARAMANFGLSRLRLVKPREPWPNPQARKMASGADRVLEKAELFDSVEA